MSDTRIIDAPPALTEKMLEGWVLTNQSCSTPGCGMPLLRSPSTVNPPSHLCVKCSPPNDSNSATNHHAPSRTSSSLSSVSQSRSSTPPTDVSVPGSPTFVPPPLSHETIRRRHQSDRASTIIAQKMLQGYAMLGEECTNPTCFGIPLVRPPKSGGEKDPRMECVICGRAYTWQDDSTGQRQLVQHIGSSDSAQDSQNAAQASSSRLLENSNITSQSHFLQSELDKVSMSASPYPDIADTLQSDILATEVALRQTLRTLSARISSLRSADRIDVSAISTVADAIHKTTLALSEIMKLRSFEK